MPAKWKTLRVVVEYRTQNELLSERDLVSHVQYSLDVRDNSIHSFVESKLWAKGFNAFRSRSEAARPTHLRAAIRRLESAIKKLKEI